MGQNLHDYNLSPIVLTGERGMTSIVDNIDVLTYLSFLPKAILGHTALNRSQEYPDYQSYLYPLPAASLITTVFCYILQLEDKLCENLVKSPLCYKKEY